MIKVVFIIVLLFMVACPGYTTVMKKNTNSKSVANHLIKANSSQKVVKITDSTLANIVDNINLSRSPFVSFRTDRNLFSTQGMCIAGDYLIESRYAGNTVPNRLYVIDIKNKKILSYMDAVLGHLNDLCYDKHNGYIYTVHGKTIYRLKLTGYTLTLAGTIPTNKSYTGIAWNNGIFYLRAAGSGHIRDIYTSTDLKDFKLLFSVDTKRDLGPQGLAADDNFIYTLYSSVAEQTERIFMFDKKTLKKVREFSFPRNIYGELEDIDFYNGYVFVNINRGRKEGGVVYKCPFYKNVPDNNFFTHTTTDVYVDTSYIIAFPNGSQSHPYNHIRDAFADIERRNKHTIINDITPNNTTNQ